MKRIIVVLLCSILIVSFAACGITDSVSTNSIGGETSGINTTPSSNDVPSMDSNPSLPFGSTITAGDCITAAITEDGQMLYTGEFTSSPGSDIISIDASADHIAVLYSDHTVRIMNKQGYRTEFYDIPSIREWTDIVAVSAGEFCTVGLRADGTVVSAGVSSFKFEGISSWTDIVAVDCAMAVIGLKSDGTVVCDDSELDVSSWTDMIAISTQSGYALGLKSDGTVVATGYRSDDPRLKVGDWTDIVAICAGLNHAVGLKSDGTVVSTEIEDKNYDLGQTDVLGFTDIVAISANYTHTIGLKSDGTIVVAGNAEEEQEKAESWTNIAFSNN